MPLEELAGGVVSNTFAVKKVENSLAYKTGWLVKAAIKDIEAAIAAIDPTSVTGPAKLQRMLKLRDEVKRLSGSVFKNINKLVTVELKEFGPVSGKLAENLLVKATLGVPVEIARGAATPKKVASIIRNEPMQGALLKDWFGSLDQKTAFAVNRQIQIGSIQNETAKQIAKRVSGLTKQTDAAAKGIVRTALNHIHTQASFETYKANSDITKGYQFLATLDSRTTDICIGYDGQFFKFEDGSAILPPLHFNCRSTIIPVVDWEKLKIDPGVMPEGTRATMINPGTGKPGQVPARWSYGDWLLAQPRTKQAEILGYQKAKMFRDGKIALKQLVNAEGASLTIAELQAVADANALVLEQTLQSIANKAAAIAAQPIAAPTEIVKVVSDVPQAKPGPIGAKTGPKTGVKVKLDQESFEQLKGQVLSQTDNLQEIGKGKLFKGVEDAKDKLASVLGHTQQNVKRAIKELKATPVKFDHPVVDEVVDFMKSAMSKSNLAILADGTDDVLAQSVYQWLWSVGQRPLSTKHVKVLAQSIVDDAAKAAAKPIAGTIDDAAKWLAANDGTFIFDKDLAKQFGISVEDAIQAKLAAQKLLGKPPSVVHFAAETPSTFLNVYSKAKSGLAIDDEALDFYRTMVKTKYNLSDDAVEELWKKYAFPLTSEDDVAWVIKEAFLKDIDGIQPFHITKLTDTVKTALKAEWKKKGWDEDALWDSLAAAMKKAPAKGPKINSLDALIASADPDDLSDFFRFAFRNHGEKVAMSADEAISIKDALLTKLNIQSFKFNELAEQLAKLEGDQLVDVFAKVYAKKTGTPYSASAGVMLHPNTALNAIDGILTTGGDDLVKFVHAKTKIKTMKIVDNIPTPSKPGVLKMEIVDEFDDLPVFEKAGGSAAAKATQAVDEAATLTEKVVLDKFVASSTGSNQYGKTGRYLGSDGQTRFVKQYKDPAQIYSEKIANDVYRGLDLGVPDMSIMTLDDGSVALVTPWLDDAKIVGTGLSKSVADDAANGFIADILTVNRDAVGTGLDNLVTSGGKLLRIDQGGAFRFRAQGAIKKGDLLDIDEWDTLFSKNQYYRDTMKKAGFSSGDDLGIRAIAQIDDLLAFEQEIGGWEAFVKKQASGMAAADQKEVVKILNQRTKLLKSKRDDLAEKLGLDTVTPVPAEAPKSAVHIVGEPPPLTVTGEIAEAFEKSFLDDVATWIAYNDPGFKLNVEQVATKFNMTAKQAKSAKFKAGWKLKKLKQTPGTAPPNSALGEAAVKHPTTTPSNLPIDEIKKLAAEAKAKGLSQVTETRPFGYAGDAPGTHFTDAISKLKSEVGADNVGNIPNVLRKQTPGVSVETVDLTAAKSLTPKGVGTSNVNDIIEQIEKSLIDTKLASPLPVNRLPVILRQTDGTLLVANQYSKDTTAALIWSGHTSTRAIVIDIGKLVTAEPDKFGFLDQALAGKLAKAANLKKKKLVTALKKKGPPPELLEAIEQSQKLKPDQRLGLWLDENALEYKLVPAPKGVKKDFTPRSYQTAGSTKPLTQSQFKVKKADNTRARTLFKDSAQEGKSSHYWGNSKAAQPIAKRTAAAKSKPAGFDQELDSLMSRHGWSSGSKTAESKVEELMKDWISRWAGSSLDSDEWSYAWQRAVHAEFKLGDDAMRALGTAGDSATRRGREIYEAHKKSMQFIVRQMYEETQADFRRRGMKELLLYRGMGTTGLPSEVTANGALVNVELRPVSSFSVSREKASNFSRGAFIAQKVPVEQVLSHHFTGLGTGITGNGEWEVAVIGTRSPALVWRSHGVTETEIFRRAKELGIN